MSNLARNTIYWPAMHEDIRMLARSCSDCAQVAKSPVKTTLASWPLCQRPMQRIHIDLAGKFMDFYYLLIVDAYSKWPEVYILNSTTSTEIIKCLDNFFAYSGYPELLVSDNGTQFVSDTLEAYLKRHGIKHLTSAPYHPQSNGQVERFVDTLKRALKKLKDKGSIRENVMKFLHHYRATPNSNCPSSLSPAELFIGRKMKTHLDLH